MGFFVVAFYQVGNLLFISMSCKLLALKKRAPFCHGTRHFLNHAAVFLDCSLAR